MPNLPFSASPFALCHVRPEPVGRPASRASGNLLSRERAPRSGADVLTPHNIIASLRHLPSGMRRALWLLPLPLLLLTLAAGCSGERVLRVGLLASLTGADSIYGAGRNLTGQWLVDRENRRPDGCLRKNGIRVELHTRNVNMDPTLVPGLTRDLLENTGVAFLMGGEGYGGVISAPLAAERGVPLCVPMDGNDGSFIRPDGTRRFPHVFATMVPASRYFAGFYRLAARNGASRLAIVEAHAPGFDTLRWMGSGSAAEAVEAGLEVVFTGRIQYDLRNLTKDGELASIEPLFGELVAAQPDVLAFATIFACDSFVRLTRKWHWRPKGAIVFECLNKLHLLDPAMIDELRGVFVPAQWHRELVGREYTDEPDRNFASHFPFSPGSSAPPSAAQMYQTIKALFDAARPPLEWHTLVAPDMACYYALFAAACLTNSTDAEALRWGMHATHIPTFAGTLSFSRLGLNPVRGTATLQLVWSTEAAAPPGELALALDGAYRPFWPLPSFEELEENTRLMSRPSDLLVLIAYEIEVVLILLTAFLLRFLSHSRTIRAMSLPLSLAHLLGLLVLLQAVPLLAYTSNLAQCRARWLVLTLGVTLSTASLSLKLYRVARIYYVERDFIRRLITNRQLLSVLSLATSVSALAVALLTCLDGQTSLERHMPNPLDRSSYYYECSYSTPGPLIGGALCVAQMAAALVLAVHARDVPHTFSAAFGSIMSAYTGVILSVLFSLLPPLVADRTSSTGLRMGLILAFPAGNLALIYVYPIASALRGIEVDRWGGVTESERATTASSAERGVLGPNPTVETPQQRAAWRG